MTGIRDLFAATMAAVLLAAAPAWAMTGAEAKAITEGKRPVPSADWQLESVPANAIRPGQIEYLGAFNVPKDGGGTGRLSWQYGGGGLTYYPKGDPKGAGDGFPGSLFGTGHERGHGVSEISIPKPRVSRKKDHTELDYAETLQPFKCVTAGVTTKGGRGWPMRIQSIGYLPAQGDQHGDRVYYGGFRSYVSTSEWSRGAFGTDFSRFKPEGLWQLEGHGAFNGVAAIMEIPKEWADRHCDGMYLAWSGNILATGSGNYALGMGPAVIAAAPWRDGDPPRPGARLKSRTLLKYGGCSTRLGVRDRQRADSWAGAAWATAGDRSAIIFVGRKDMGETYYGYPKTPEGYKVYDNRGKVPGGTKYAYRDFDGKLHPYGKYNGGRGWKADFPRACFYFYDPEDLAKVAQGKMKPHEPQYYARLDVSKHMLKKGNTPRGCGYDRERGLLYACERKVAGRFPVIHVWRLREGGREGADADDASSASKPPGRAPSQEWIADRLMCSARDAERRGRGDVARQLYERIMKRYPDSPQAEEAWRRLRALPSGRGRRDA